MTLLTLSPIQIQKLTKTVNEAFTKINGRMHTGMPLRDITLVLTTYGLETEKIQEHLNGDQGRMSVPVGSEMYLTMTWHRMESGRYEIVIYATSTYDDYREPYTTVMNAAAKRKAKDKLNDLLTPINKKYFMGKAEPFSLIQDAIAACGFDRHEFEDQTVAGQVNGNEGRKHIAIGNDIYMTLTWYNIGSRYEIVAYAS